MVTGEWRARKNRELVAKARDKLTTAESIWGMEIVFEHVKGHSGETGNNKADENANKGAAGGTKTWANESMKMKTETKRVTASITKHVIRMGERAGATGE